MAESKTQPPARRDPVREVDPFESWNPFQEFGGSPVRLTRLLDDLLGRSAAGKSSRWAPAVDIAEDDTKFVISAELPGAAKDDVNVEVHDNVMTIRGEKRSEREGKKQQTRWVERSYGAFSRSFTLPANADAARVNASFKDGVLTIELPKSEAAKPKVISIK